jgi:hypothetical protein
MEERFKKVAGGNVNRIRKIQEVVGGNVNNTVKENSRNTNTLATTEVGGGNL